jgi:hypothetical protein
VVSRVWSVAKRMNRYRLQASTAGTKDLAARVRGRVEDQMFAWHRYPWGYVRRRDFHAALASATARRKFLDEPLWHA